MRCRYKRLFWEVKGKWVKQSAGMWVSKRVKGGKVRVGRRGRATARVQPCAGVCTCTQNRCFPAHLQAPWLGAATLALLRQRAAYPPSVQLGLWVKWRLISRQKATGWRSVEAPPSQAPSTTQQSQIPSTHNSPAAWGGTGERRSYRWLCWFFKPRLEFFKISEWNWSDPAYLNHGAAILSYRVIINDYNNSYSLITHYTNTTIAAVRLLRRVVEGGLIEHTVFHTV